MVIVIARFRPRPDRRDDLVALLEEVQAASRRDDGCLHYGYYTEIGEPLSFIAVEEWRDNDALAAHLRQPHVARLIAALPELGDGRLEIATHEVAASGPLPLPGRPGRTMSQENVEIKRGWDAWVRGDLDAVLELFDPAVEWETTHLEGWPEDAVYFGRDGVRRFFDEWIASWERYESGADKIQDAGGDRVLVICWQQGFGPGSAVPVRMDWAQIVSVRGGLVYRLEAYSDRHAALEAVGLSE